MTRPTASVLIASTRPAALTCCLESLAVQTERPAQVLVAWQGDDTPTRDAARSAGERTGLPVTLVHSPERGVVPAENAALAAAAGEVVMLIDDDAVAPPDWVARHLRHYSDPSVGAVGGGYVNFHPDGTPFPVRTAEAIGVVRWNGVADGNMYDHPPDWDARPTRRVHHLVGLNMSLRRSAFTRFEPALKPYWQSFELDACFQVRRAGFDVLFDFANRVRHYPSNQAFAGGRDGDLAVKIFNPTFNHAFVFAKHLSGWRRAAYLLYHLAVGQTGSPGLAAWAVNCVRYGRPWRELVILANTARARASGWRAGTRTRRRHPT